MEEKKGKYTFVDKREEKNAPPQTHYDLGKKEAESAESRARQEQSPSRELPTIDFSTLVMSFATSAIVAMGKAPEPHTGQVLKDMAMACQNIEIIALLQDKTKGNRTREEDNLLEGILYELRLMYVEAQGEKR
jgi:hypothetical protein